MVVAREPMYVQIYGFDINVIVTDDLLEYAKEHVGLEDKHNILLCQGSQAVVFDYRGQEHDFDFEVVFDVKGVSNRTINHETVHLTSRIMRYIGCPLTPETEEPYSYLSDYIFAGLVRKTSKLKEEIINILRKEEEENGNPNTREKVRPTNGGSTTMETSGSSGG